MEGRVLRDISQGVPQAKFQDDIDTDHRSPALLFSNIWDLVPPKRPDMPRFLSDLHSIIASTGSRSQSELPTRESTVSETDASTRSPRPISTEVDPVPDKSSNKSSNIDVLSAYLQRFLNDQYLVSISRSLTVLRPSALFESVCKKHSPI
jgi:hypothetical protein